MAISLDAIDPKDLEQLIKTISAQTKVVRQLDVNQNGEVLTKETLGALSNNITDLRNSFNKILAYGSNVEKIKQAEIKADERSRKENALERPSSSSAAVTESAVSGPAQNIISAEKLTAITKQMGELAKVLKELNLQAASGNLGGVIPPVDVQGKPREGARGKAGRADAETTRGRRTEQSPIDTETRRSRSPRTQAPGTLRQRPRASVLKGLAIGAVGAGAYGMYKVSQGMAAKKDTPEQDSSVLDKFIKSVSSVKKRVKDTGAEAVQKTAAVAGAAVAPVAEKTTEVAEKGATAVKEFAGGLTGGVGTTAANFVAEFEGFEKKSYLIPGEKFYTIGFGHQIQTNDLKSGMLGQTGVPVVGEMGKDTVISKEAAIKLLQQDLPKYEAPAKRALGGAWEKLNESQKAAFISYSYNAGGGGVSKFIKKNNIAALIEQGDFKGVAEAFRERGVRTGSGRIMKGLVRRRAAEADLILSRAARGAGEAVGTKASAAATKVTTTAAAVGSAVGEVGGKIAEGAKKGAVTGGFIHPLGTVRITSPFGPRKSPAAGASTQHKGIDYGPRKPGTQGDAVKASASGIVAKAGVGKGYGNVIYLKHDDGYETRYAHLSGFTVGEGQRVTQGQQIGTLGNTGIGSGPHLHFEVLKAGERVNPLTLLGGGTVSPDPSATEPGNEPTNAPGQVPAAPVVGEMPKVASKSSDMEIAKKEASLANRTGTGQPSSSGQGGGMGRPMIFPSGKAGGGKPATPSRRSQLVAYLSGR